MATEVLYMEELAREPIPELPSVDGWKDIRIRENGEPLVTLGSLGIASASFYAGIHNFSPYYKDSLKGSLQKVYVREGLGEALQQAQTFLPDDMCLIGLDGFRPDSVQKSLYNSFLNRLTMLRPDWSEEARELYTQKYVSKPSTKPATPAPHATGGSIDQWLVRLNHDHSRHDIPKKSFSKHVLKNSVWLPAGAPFDHGGESSALRYYEENDDTQEAIEFRQNRRILYWILKSAGIEVYPEEFWHGNLGNQMAAKTTGVKKAVYGKAALSDAQKKIEKRLRSKPLKVGKKMYTAGYPEGEIIQPDESSLPD